MAKPPKPIKRVQPQTKQVIGKVKPKPVTGGVGAAGPKIKPQWKVGPVQYGGKWTGGATQPTAAAGLGAPQMPQIPTPVAVAAGQADPLSNPYDLAKKIVEDTIAAQRASIERDRARQQTENAQQLAALGGFGGALAHWDEGLAGQQNADFSRAAQSQQNFAQGFQNTYNQLSQGNAQDTNAWMARVNPQGAPITPQPQDFLQAGANQAAIYQAGQATNPWSIVSQADARQSQMDLNAMAATQARDLTKFDDQIASLYDDYGKNVLDYYTTFRGITDQEKQQAFENAQTQFGNQQTLFGDQQTLFENRLALSDRAQAKRDAVQAQKAAVAKAKQDAQIFNAKARQHAQEVNARNQIAWAKLRQHQVDQRLKAVQFDTKTGMQTAKDLTNEFGYYYQYNPKTGKVSQKLVNGKPVEVPGTNAYNARLAAAREENRQAEWGYVQGTKRAEFLQDHSGVRWDYDPNTDTVQMARVKNPKTGKWEPIVDPGSKGAKAIEASKNRDLARQDRIDKYGRDEAWRRTQSLQRVFVYNPKTGQIEDTHIPTAKGNYQKWQENQRQAEAAARAHHQAVTEGQGAQRIAISRARAATAKANAAAARQRVTPAKDSISRAKGFMMGTKSDGSLVYLRDETGKKIKFVEKPSSKGAPPTRAQAVGNRYKAVSKMQKYIANDTTKRDFNSLADAQLFYMRMFDADIRRFNLDRKVVAGYITEAWTNSKNVKSKSKSGGKLTLNSLAK